VDDRLGTRPDAVIVHFIDPENKPWDWRVWPYGGFFAHWLDLTDQVGVFLCYLLCVSRIEYPRCFAHKVL
jgi:hypothetical protein